MMARTLKAPGVQRILAIDPGTREMGYAVIDGSELVYFGVHSVKRRWPYRVLVAEGQKVVDGLIDGCMPSRVVIGEASAARWTRSPRLRRLIEKLKRSARRRGARLVSYPLVKVKEVIAGDRKATKRMVIDELVTTYPFLAKYREADAMGSEKYWENMFEAVALALTSAHQISRRRH